MNERIRQLAKKAGIKIAPMVVDGVEYEYEDVDMDGSEDLAKFAKLIVRECYEWAKENGGLGAEYDYDALKEHLGVEE